MLNYSQTKLIEDPLAHLEELWVADYQRVTPGRTEIVWVELEEFLYAFDIQAERLIGGCGTSRGRRPRQDGKGRQAEFPKSSNPLDEKGHIFARVLGGGLDINLVHQRRSLNNGPFRRMENTAKQSPGAFYFVYCKYIAPTGQRPASFEQGLLVPGTDLQKEEFVN